MLLKKRTNVNLIPGKRKEISKKLKIAIRAKFEKNLFIEKISKVPESDLNYFGIAICGSKKKINKLTGSMPLLR